MNWIKDLRTQTGLSQIQLCYWLQIPKSTLAMAESGQRDLPNEPHLKLTGLYVAMLKPEVKAAAAQETVTAPTTSQLEALHKKISSQARKLRLKAWTLQRQIDERKTRQAQREQMRLLLTALTHLHETTPPSEYDARWLQRRKEEWQDEAAADHIFELQRLQLRLDMIEMEATKLEEMASALKPVLNV